MPKGVPEDSGRMTGLMYVTILAGGGGTRLWPLSRKATPKQFLQLLSERTMLQATVDRVLPLTATSQMYVVTAGDYVASTREQLPELPPEHVIGEPRARNTALAIGLAAVYIAHEDPDAIMASVGSDHLIRNVDLFRATLLAGAEAAAQGDYLVTIGITPTEPHIGYGYIQAGDEELRANAMSVRSVLGFQEKPDRDTAQRYLESGNYYWNTNYFVWKVSSILRAIEEHAPDLAAHLDRIRRAIGTPREDEVIREVYDQARSEAIDPAILEKASNLLVVPATFDWSDVGSWSDLYQLAETNEKNAMLRGELSQHLSIDSEGCLVFPGDRLVATIGLTDIVVVNTPDVILICPKDRAQDVKKLVEELQRRNQTNYL